MRLICGVDPIKPKIGQIPFRILGVYEIDYECNVIVVTSPTKTHLKK